MLEEPIPKLANKTTFYCKDQRKCPACSDQSKCCFVTSKHKKIKDSCCCDCSRRRHTSPLTCIGICILILVYTLLGAFIFLAIEGTLSSQKEETAVAASKSNLSATDTTGFDIRSRTVEKLWSITEDLNILYKENWTRLAAKELMEFQKVLVKTMRGRGFDGQLSYYDGIGSNHKWTFATSFLYALTLITTIGYGNVTPKTTIGKTVAIAYACIGIPIVMVYLSTIGDALARSFRIFYSKTCRTRDRRHFHTTSECDRFSNQRKSLRDFSKKGDVRTPFQAALNLDSLKKHYHWTCRDQTRVPIILCIFLIIVYLVIGTLIFNKTEKWSYLEGCFFSFSSLGTIGFGDLYPGFYGSTESSQAEDLAICICCIYILIGVIVVAMCFNLIQEEITVSLKNFTDICGGNGKSRAVHDAEKDIGEEISMSIVS